MNEATDSQVSGSAISVLPRPYLEMKPFMRSCSCNGPGRDQIVFEVFQRSGRRSSISILWTDEDRWARVGLD